MLLVNSNLEKGFTLFEVVVSMFIVGVALLGLIKLEIKILQSSTSSFDYTVSTIQANNYIDAIWIDLCKVQNGLDGKYATIKSEWVTELATFNKQTEISPSGSAFNKYQTVTVKWSDSRFNDSLSNQEVNVFAHFPIFPSTCH